MNIKGLKIMEGTSIKAHIKKFINSIPKWEGFTIDEVAGKFSVSQGYISKIIKEMDCMVLIPDKVGPKAMIVNPKHKGEYLEDRSKQQD